MSKFYVGQRVRLITSRFGITTGRIGTVRSAPYMAIYTGSQVSGLSAPRLWVALDIDGYPSVKKPHWDCPVEWLEPISGTDPQETTTWAHCAWRPEMVRA